jgi:hypothetical protein
LWKQEIPGDFHQTIRECDNGKLSTAPNEKFAKSTAGKAWAAQAEQNVP